ncbi:MAG: DUF2927 domain-containing protein [Xanthomarina gelatinilytica]|uniref:DUF2927 domain-containing protein n=1 Tax=Xanthomarina gelatinilytica TaxID=1137281 RepID=UPI003A879945
MYYRNKTTLGLTLLSILVVFLILFQYFGCSEEKYIPTKYEREVIEYFKEISLQSEYNDNPQKVIKWKEPMILYVVKEEEFKPQMLTIKNTIDEINQLSSDGFKIILTNNLSKCNSILYLCSKERIAELNPEFFITINNGIDYDISGYSYSEFDTKTHIIDKAMIFISSEYSLDVQKATILEEIVQSLGLAFDSNSYSNSIFYKNKSKQDVRIQEYSRLDKDIIRLLYHPKMRPGLDSIELMRVIKKILKSEKN